jgi:AcrR family transcriptional regulator
MARQALSWERVLEAAVGLADGHGIESLTMRKLAAELGVEAMSLYNHVANKGDLVEGMVDLVFAEIELPENGRDWRSAVRTCAVSAHQAYLRHPWACGCVISPSGPGVAREPRMRYMEWLLATLGDAGFPPELTFSAYHALDSQIVGFTLWQLGHVAAATQVADGQEFEDFAAAFIPQLRAGGYQHLADHAEQHLASAPGEGEREFAFTLDLILDGLSRALEGAAARPPRRARRGR